MRQISESRILLFRELNQTGSSSIGKCSSMSIQNSSQLSSLQALEQRRAAVSQRHQKSLERDGMRSSGEKFTKKKLRRKLETLSSSSQNNSKTKINIELRKDGWIQTSEGRICTLYHSRPLQEGIHRNALEYRKQGACGKRVDSKRGNLEPFLHQSAPYRKRARACCKDWKSSLPLFYSCAT